MPAPAPARDRADDAALAGSPVAAVTGLAFARSQDVLALLRPPVFVAAALVALVAVAPTAFARADEPPQAPEWLVAPRLPPPALRPPTYFEQHSARVAHDLLMFQHGYTLETMRERDSLYLYGPTPGTTQSTALGVGLFSAIVVSSAHTPGFLRFAFDRSLHFGPAIFDGGGMGAGFGGHM